MSSGEPAGEEAQSSKSLIQQRTAIDRDKKTNGIWALVLLLFLIVIIMVSSSAHGEWWSWMQVLAFAFLSALRVRGFADALDAEKVFDAEHGKSAGKQDPVP
jgi:hypothetical protein